MARTVDKTQGIQVIARAAAILRALGPEPMSLGALARETNLPRSTVQRIVDALAAEQLVEAGEDGVRPGWGLQRLTTVGEVDVVSVVHPHLEWLFGQTRETVDLAMGQGKEVVFLDHIVCDQTLRVVPIIERPRALHLMANGKAILSAMSDATVRKLLDGRRGRSGGADRVDPAALLKELAGIRSSGFAFDRAGHAEGVHAVGTPVRVEGLRPYALSIAAPSCRFEAGLAKFKSALRECRRRVEADLAQRGR
jgi:DNA-binding IclR family transcriptional regulator